MNFFEQILHDLEETFIKNNFYMLFLEGLGNTLLITLGAAILGMILGLLVAIIKISAKKNHKLRIPEKLCDIYVTVIRGTPVVLQLFIMTFIVFAIRGFPVIITAILTFGINSGAYVAENMRAGIQSIDIGQSEAGRSLGLSHGQTMRYIVLPQAIKNIIPTIGNEFIALLKETSVVSTIAIIDISNAAKVVGGRNANFFFPMLCAALLYLSMVYGLSALIKRLERRLHRSDRG